MACPIRTDSCYRRISLLVRVCRSSGKRNGWKVILGCCLNAKTYSSFALSISFLAISSFSHWLFFVLSLSPSASSFLSVSFFLFFFSFVQQDYRVSICQYERDGQARDKATRTTPKERREEEGGKILQERQTNRQKFEREYE